MGEYMVRQLQLTPKFTRIVLGIQVTSAAVTLPSKIIAKKPFTRSLAVLLGPVMVSAVLIGAGFTKACVQQSLNLLTEQGVPRDDLARVSRNFSMSSVSHDGEHPDP
jgi:hypothetical protein